MSTDRIRHLRRLTSGRVGRLGRELFWVSLGQAAAALGSLVGVRLLTGVLSPDTYGELALGLTLATLVSQVLLGPLSGATLRFCALAQESDQLEPFLKALRGLMSKAAVVVLAMAVSASLLLLLARRMRWLALTVTALGFALLSGYNATFDSLQNARRRRTVVAWHQALYAWALFLTAVGMVLWLGNASEAAMLGYILANMLVLSSQFYFYSRTAEHRVSAPTAETTIVQRWESQLLAYAWPIATWGIFSWAQMASDRWALQLFTSTEDVGLYTVLHQLGYFPISVIAGLIAQWVSPVLFQRAGDASDASRMQHVRALNWRMTIGALALTGGATLLAVAVRELAFRWLAGPDYRAVSWMLPGMTLAGGLSACSQLAAISLLSGAETRSLVVPKIVTAVVGVLLNMVCAARWGIWGVVSASVATAAMHLVWVVGLVRARHNELLVASEA